MNFKDILQNFFLGGLIVTITSYLGNQINPLWAAVFWSFPLSLLPTLYTMRASNKSNDYISKFLFGTTFTLILLFIATFALSKFFKRASKSESIASIIFKGAAVWGIFSALFLIFVKIAGYEEYFM